MSKTVLIRVNGEKVFLDLQSFRKGKLRLDGSAGEQCEGCGGDLLENGTVDTEGFPVTIGARELVGTIVCACRANYSAELVVR